jgi:hypothetical protein
MRSRTSRSPVRREVPRDLELVERELLGGFDADALRTARDPATGSFEQSLGVVSRRDRLDDRRLSVGEEAGEQDRRLELGRWQRKLVVDGVEWTAFHDKGRVAVRRLHERTHAAKRFRDALHGTH